MNPFHGTVDYYRKYRPGLPQEVTDVLDTAVPRRTPRRLLDIGTGTGLVVAGLVESFDDIIGIDTDADMLEAADAELRPRLPRASHLMLTQSAAEDFTPPVGWQADLVTICRTFHWVDQPAVLARADDYVKPDGAVAVFSDSSFWTGKTPWQDCVRSVLQSFLGDQRRAGTSTFQQHSRQYRDILRDSPFGEVEEIRVPVRRTWQRASILGYLYSTSFAAPHLFGSRRAEFEQTLTAQLRQFSEEDAYVEDNEFVILIGRREQTHGSGPHR